MTQWERAPERWGRGLARGVGRGSGGSNECAPRPEPACALNAAGRLVANVTVCKRRGVVKGAGRGRAAGLLVTPATAFVPELVPQKQRQEVEGVGMAMGAGLPF